MCGLCTDHDRTKALVEGYKIALVHLDRSRTPPVMWLLFQAAIHRLAQR